jgi:hypothetical protein
MSLKRAVEITREMVARFFLVEAASPTAPGDPRPARLEATTG